MSFDSVGITTGGDWIGDMGEEGVKRMEMYRVGISSDLTLVLACSGERGGKLSDYVGEVRVILRPQPDNGESMTVSCLLG
jgi:hypothetical protein